MRQLLRPAASLAALGLLSTGCGPLIREAEPVVVVTEVGHPVDVDGGIGDGAAPPGFGFLVDVDEERGRVALDVAEWLTGDAANEAARAAGLLGEGETEVPNGYFILNGEVDEVWLQLDDAARLVVMTNPGDPTTETAVDLEGFALFVQQNPVSPFDVSYTPDGTVSELRFVYRP